MLGHGAVCVSVVAWWSRRCRLCSHGHSMLWWSQRSKGGFSAVSGSRGGSFSADGPEVSAGARCGKAWSVYASGGRLRSGCLFVVSWWSRRYRRGSGSSHGHSMAWRLPGCFGGASAESEVSVPQGDSMLVSAVSVVSGLFQYCWSRVQCWVWCDENLSACDSEEARCSGCRAIRRSEQVPCVKNTIHQQPVNGPHSTRIRVSDPWVSWYHLLPLVRIERFA